MDVHSFPVKPSSSLFQVSQRPFKKQVTVSASCSLGCGAKSAAHFFQRQRRCGLKPKVGAYARLPWVYELVYKSTSKRLWPKDVACPKQGIGFDERYIWD